jgi:methyl-accepting chemotaxis protein
MALVKKTDLGKTQGSGVTPLQTPIAPSAPKHVVSKHREQSRTRARQEKAAERIGAATEELAAGMAQAASAAQELGHSLVLIARSAEEAGGAAQESQASINNLGSVFAQARSKAEESRLKTDKLQGLVSEIGAQIEGLAASVQENSAGQLVSVQLVSGLESQAAGIGEITVTVGDISDQTNLLALNAAIEAARAGDHGLGFAVVADEVRAFAEVSEKSARDVKVLADGIALEVRTISAKIKSAGEQAQVEAGNGRAVLSNLIGLRESMKGLADVAGKILISVTGAEQGAREAQRGAEQIAAAAEEQASAAAQAQQAVQQQASSLEQSQKTSQALASLAEALQTNAGTVAGGEDLASSAEELSAAVQELSGAAAEILAALDQIGRGTHVQAAATQQSTAAMSQIEKAAAAMRDAATRSVKNATGLIASLAENRDAVSKLVSSVADGLSGTQTAVGLLSTLEISSRRIEKIIDGITLVSVQINMLAVSGSVEAARAGEFGRGFAVVSADIRELARDSSENAERVKDMVRVIQEQIASVRRDLELIAASSQAEVRKNQSLLKGLSLVESEMSSVSVGLTEILGGADAALAAVREVTISTQQIAAAAEEAAKSAAQAATAAREQATGAEDLAAAIEEIASLADEIQIAT